jgi:hypothetical protein
VTTCDYLFLSSLPTLGNHHTYSLH